MSNLLNNKKRLLDRGPKITPTQEFKIEENTSTTTATETTPTATTNNKTKKNDTHTITSVRVTKATRNKLNAFIQMGRAESVDIMLDILIDEYISNNFVKEDKKIFDLFVDVANNRNNQ